MPGLRSSRIHIVDVKDDPKAPKLTKVIEADEIASKTGYSRPHTIHCGPDGIYVSALGNPEGDGPGGIFLLDHENFSVKGAWEQDRGPQELAYDFWWHLNQGTVITSEWGTPNMVESGLQPELLLSNQYGHKLHIWDLEKRKHVQEIDLGAEHQMVLELRPGARPAQGLRLRRRRHLDRRPHRPRSGCGSATATARSRPRRSSPSRRSRPRPSSSRRPCSRSAPCRRWSPTSRCRSTTRRSSSPAGARASSSATTSRTRTTRARRAPCASAASSSARAHPAAGPLNGGPQMVELSRDGKRVYLTNSLYASWDAQFYPEGIDGWFVKLDAGDDGSLTLDPDVFVEYSGERPHQVRLGGGDASSDSYCFPD